MTVLRVDGLILGTMKNEKAFNKMLALNLNEIRSGAGGSLQNLRIRIKKLLDDGYIQEGYRAGNGKTYFITEKGLKLLDM